MNQAFFFFFDKYDKGFRLKLTYIIFYSYLNMIRTRYMIFRANFLIRPMNLTQTQHNNNGLELKGLTPIIKMAELRLTYIVMHRYNSNPTGEYKLPHLNQSANSRRLGRGIEI